MLILYSAGKNKKILENSIAAIFGVGLIGTFLARNLNQQQYKTIHTLPFSWHYPQQRKKQTTDILNYIQNLIENLAPASRIDFVWSAGKGGFGLKEVDTVPELEAFAEVVEMAMTILRKNPSCMVRFHMLSSAGGLFEGQRNVSAQSLPNPQRPYGFLKIAQEKILEDRDELVRLIYRPTSVYGFAGLNHRFGLIPTLLWNGPRNKVCTIFGAPETLRDYVWTDDIGAFIAERVQSSSNDSVRFTLASGKPTMLYEIVSHIEKILNKKLFRHYIRSGGNAEDNTFSPQSHPQGWNPLDLETGIRKTRFAMITNSNN